MRQNLFRPRNSAPALPPYICGAGAILCWATLAAGIGESLRKTPPETVLFQGLLAAAGFLGLWRLWRRRGALPAWRGG